MVNHDVIAPLKSSDPTAVGRFELVGRLGVGGMGVAFLARSTGGPAVVKMIQLDFADDPEARRRFRREVLAASTVETPFVPEVLASDVSTERQWVAMEYVTGPTLEELLRTSGPLAPPRQRALAAALAAGLSDLHRHGLIHRDLKPSNVISTDTGPRIIDFGVAVLENLSNITRTGGLAPGSPGWMAPEQLQPDTTPTAAIDVFSWGCLCWYAATGSSPIWGDTIEERLANLRGWTGPAVIPVELDDALAPLVTRALATSPDERPTAAELTSNLAADGETVSLAQVAGAWIAGGREAMATVAWVGADDLPTSIAPTQTTPLTGWQPAVGSRVHRPWRKWAVVVGMTLAVAAVAVATAAGLGAFTNEQTPASATRSSGATVDATPEGTNSLPGSAESSGTPQPTATQTEPAQSDQPSKIPTGSVPEFLADYGGNKRVGYGNVKLGMTLEELLASGDTLAVDTNPSGCTDYPLKAGGTATYSSMQGRVVYITFAGQMATSKGVMVGSTDISASQAYGASYDAYGEMRVPVAEGVTYLIASDGSGYVAAVVLLSRAQDCAG